MSNELVKILRRSVDNDLPLYKGIILKAYDDGMHALVPSFEFIGKEMYRKLIQLNIFDEPKLQRSGKITYFSVGFTKKGRDIAEKLNSERHCESIVTKNYQPPQGLPFKSRGSYETDKGLYLRKRESLYRKNAVAWRRTTREILKASKAGTQADETEHEKVVQEHTTLIELDKFFDIREEC